MTENASTHLYNTTSVVNFSPMKRDIIFIVAPIQRCGSNFLARALCMHPEVTRPVGPHEWLGMKNIEHLLTYAQESENCGLRFSFSKETILASYEEYCINYWHNTLPEEERSKHLIHKSVDPTGFEHFRAIFPEGKLILLVRNGKDTVNSYLRARMKHKISWFKRKALLFYISALWAKRLKKTLQVQQEVKDSFFITYEELTQDTAKFSETLKFLNIEPTTDFSNAVENLTIKGSGFYQAGKEQLSETSDTNWGEEKKTKDFKPVGRWRNSWSFLDKMLYDIATLFADKRYR